MLTRRQFLLGGSLLLASLAESGCQRRWLPVQGATSAERAIKAARRFAGTTLRVGWESGPQAQDLLHLSGPLWEHLTGIKIDVVELGLPSDELRRLKAEQRAATGALDCGSVAPSWVPDLLADGALEPLDDFIARYGVAADFDDYLPIYRTLGIWNGRTYGLFDDGDELILYYRKDLFEASANKRAFSAMFGRPLGDPRTYDWPQLLDATRFFTHRGGPDFYGMAPFNLDQTWGWFQAYLRVNGGRFFDPETMKPEVNSPAGRRALENLLALQATMPPWVGEVSFDPSLATYLSGRSAMAGFWPPLGRWAERYGTSSPMVEGLPITQVVGRTGYALLPGGHSEVAVGYMLSLFSHSRHQEAAYLFLQWLNSPDVSLRRVMLPYSLRDPFRQSHIRSKRYRALWPTAPAYLDTLQEAAEVALLDLAILGADDYENAFSLALTNIRLGMAPAEALDRMAVAWDDITRRVGRDRQKAAYAQFLARPGAMPRRGGAS